MAANDGKPLPLYQKALCGLTAGAIGASVGNPADLALIRMQADATLPEAHRRHYKNAFHALTRIIKDEGVLALWKGAGPTVVRAMALNMGMLASYDQSVEFFRDSLSFGEIPTVIGMFWLMFSCHKRACVTGLVDCCMQLRNHSKRHRLCCNAEDLEYAIDQALDFLNRSKCRVWFFCISL
jgi:hypothetical protein